MESARGYLVVSLILPLFLNFVSKFLQYPPSP